MKEIIKYESYDGVIFDKKEDCIDYEKFAKEIDELLETKNFLEMKDFKFPGIIGNVEEKWEKFKKIAYKFSLRFCPEFKNHDRLLKIKDPQNFPGDKFSGRFGYHDWPCIWCAWYRFKAIDFKTGIEYMCEEIKNNRQE